MLLQITKIKETRISNNLIKKSAYWYISKRFPFIHHMKESFVRFVSPDEDLNMAINEMDSVGGGTIILGKGSYSVNRLPSSIHLTGSGSEII